MFMLKLNHNFSNLLVKPLNNKVFQAFIYSGPEGGYYTNVDPSMIRIDQISGVTVYDGIINIPADVRFVRESDLSVIKNDITPILRQILPTPEHNPGVAPYMLLREQVSPKYNSIGNILDITPVAQVETNISDIAIGLKQIDNKGKYAVAKVEVVNGIASQNLAAMDIILTGKSTLVKDDEKFFSNVIVLRNDDKLFTSTPTFENYYHPLNIIEDDAEIISAVNAIFTTAVTPEEILQQLTIISSHQLHGLPDVDYSSSHSDVYCIRNSYLRNCAIATRTWKLLSLSLTDQEGTVLAKNHGDINGKYTITTHPLASVNYNDDWYDILLGGLVHSNKVVVTITDNETGITLSNKDVAKVLDQIQDNTEVCNYLLYV